MINQPAETAEERKLKCILRLSCLPVCVLKSDSFSLGNNFINWQRTVFFWPGPRLSRLDCSQGSRCVPQSGPRYQLTILVLDMIKKNTAQKSVDFIHVFICPDRILGQLIHAQTTMTKTTLETFEIYVEIQVCPFLAFSVILHDAVVFRYQIPCWIVQIGSNEKKEV